MKVTKEITKFLNKPNFMVLSTLKKDGSIQSSVVWYKFDGKVFRISVTSTRIKYKNISRDPRVSVLIQNQKNPYQYVQFSGKVTGETREGGHDFIDTLSKHYLGKDKYPNDPKREEDRITLTIAPNSLTQMGF